ncbi:9383_t:CDS:2, partial [Gigaspora rosea]
QRASYKLSELPFNKPFEPDCQTPQTWMYLYQLLYYLSLTSVFLKKVEALAKIHRYYTTHAKEEISHIDHELTLEDVLATLDLEEIFDLNHEIFRENGQNNNIRSDSEHVAEEDPNYNYDVDDLVDE